MLPAMNTWWKDDPSESYWIVSTDHDGSGHGLIAWRLLDREQDRRWCEGEDIQFDLSAALKSLELAEPPWHQSLIMHVRSGDRVFHYWSDAAAHKRQSVVACSTVEAAPQEGEYSWNTLGKDPGARVRHPPGTPAFSAPLRDRTWLEPAITLQ